MTVMKCGYLDVALPSRASAAAAAQGEAQERTQQDEHEEGSHRDADDGPGR